MPTRRNVLSIGLYPKIVLVFMATIIPILIVGSLLILNGEKAIRKEINNSLSSRVHFYVSELHSTLEHIVSLKREYVYDYDIQKFTTMSPILSDFERRQEVIAIQKKMRTLKSSNAYIADVGLFLVSENKIIYPERITYDISEEEKQIHQVLNKQSTQIVVWKDRLVLAERFPTGIYEDNLPAYWIEIVLDKQKIEKALSQMLTEEGGNAILSDENGAWTLRGDKGEEWSDWRTASMDISSDLGAGQSLVSFGGQDYIAAFEAEPSMDIVLTLYMPEEVVLKPLAGYQIWFRVLIATAVVIHLLFAYWIYLFLQRPLQRLVRAFRKVSEGSFDVQLRSRNRDEIDYFYEQFNRMVSTIQSLVRDVYEQGVRSQSAELKHLQAQINPHFLYNTYYRLHRMVQDEDYDNIKAYARLLGDYLKYITRNAQEEATLRSEVEHAKTYADILKTRFRDKLTIEWEALPPAWDNTLIPRLIVQPIVENAFIHGLEELDGHGVLRFTVHEYDRGLALVIEDNGGSLTDEQLEELVRSMDSPSDFKETTGVLNVHRRLRLKFGAISGIRCSRSELGGLRVEIRLPATEGDA